MVCISKWINPGLGFSRSARRKGHAPTSSSSRAVVVTDPLPPLPEIQSAQTREQIFTHISLTAPWRRRGEFEASRDIPSRDNEELAHIGDQVVSLAVTNLIQSRHPRLRVGPTSKLRDRIKCGGALAEIAVQYGLHESLRTQAPSLKASQNVQVDVFKAYVGGLFREQGMDVVEPWLNPLFGPRIDVAYLAERRDHLVPEPSAPATTSRTPSQAAPAPSPSGGVTEIPSQASADMHARLRSATVRNIPGKSPSVAAPPHGEKDRPNSGRKRRGASLRDGGSGDTDEPDSRYADRPTSATPRRLSPATVELAESSTRKRRRPR